MAATRVCKVPDGIFASVSTYANERGISFVSALEILWQQGQDSILQLEEMRMKPRINPAPNTSRPVIPMARGGGSNVSSESRSFALQSRNGHVFGV